MLHSTFYDLSDSFYEKNIQDPMSSLGIVISSGTVANITALCVARNQAFPADKIFKGVAEEGLSAALHYYGYQDSIILVSPLLHYSFEKAASLLGIGKKNILHIPFTDEYNLDINTLRKNIVQYQKEKKHIMAIVGIAGATETGTIDPLIAIATIAHEFGIHFHVDAAFGGPFIFSDKYRSLLQGIHHADSITVCGHKQLYLPMGISICLFKDPKINQVIYTNADYQATKESFDFGKSSLEGSRPALSLLLHASLYLIGKKGYEQIISKGMENAHYLKNCILENDDFELLLNPVINIVNYRYIPKKFRQKVTGNSLTIEDNEHIDKANLMLQNQQFKDGKTFISKTNILSHKYLTEILTLRSVLANPLTTFKDIDEVLNDQLRIASIYIENETEFSNSRSKIKSMPGIEKSTFQRRTLQNHIVPIGRPISNTQIYILDKHLQPVPIGVYGELYIGGDGLAVDYLRKPDLTSEKFIPNPFADPKDPQNYVATRLYRTGDLARFRSDGNIEYLGRIDNQIKLRGIRLELGEIESIIIKQNGVKDVMVIVSEDELLQKRLIAYIITKDQLLEKKIVDKFVNELQGSLKLQLPSYMIPNAFVLLKNFPLNPNGKIDKKALPSPEEYYSTEKYVVPQNVIEQKLVEIWSKLLKLETEKISIHDNFFNLGGHSLLATLLKSRIEQYFNIKLELRVLFNKPTIKQIADVICELYIPPSQMDTLDEDTLNQIQFDKDFA